MFYSAQVVQLMKKLARRYDIRMDSCSNLSHLFGRPDSCLSPSTGRVYGLSALC